MVTKSLKANLQTSQREMISWNWGKIWTRSQHKSPQMTFITSYCTYWTTEQNSGLRLLPGRQWSKHLTTSFRCAAQRTGSTDKTQTSSAKQISMSTVVSGTLSKWISWRSWSRCVLPRCSTVIYSHRKNVWWLSSNAKLSSLVTALKLTSLTVTML
jgi:hypothetical protein